MKFSITTLSLLLSVNAFAYSLADSTVLTTASPLLTSVTSSGGLEKAQANIVLNDAQELMQSGKMSVFLSQKIREVQNANAGSSEEEALDVLINTAESLLN